MRKVVGARKKHLIVQFLSESLLINFLGAIAAALLIQLVIPYFNDLVGKSILRSALNLAQGQPITTPCLQDHLQARKKPVPRECRLGGEDPVTLAEAEKCHILSVYAQTGNNKTQSAKLLDIGLNTLRRKLKAYGVEQEDT